MQATVQYVLETELEWLFYQLWTKNTARAPTFSFDIAETVILRQGTPQTWYFSSKEGYILKKNHQNVRIAKISKRFNKKNGMVPGCKDDMPAATTYMYKPQRNTDTGEERIALRLGYVAGKDLGSYIKASAAHVLEGGSPNVLQMFSAPKMMKNSLIKVSWSLTQMNLLRISNKLPLFDQRYSLVTRSVTAEDQYDSLFTDSTVLPNHGYTYERLYKAMSEIYNHTKKNSDITITGGTFYFKLDDAEKPVLIFATQIKTDRPILVLNGSISMALVMQDPLPLSFEQQQLLSKEKPIVQSTSAIPTTTKPLSATNEESEQSKYNQSHHSQIVRDKSQSFEKPFTSKLLNDPSSSLPNLTQVDDKASDNQHNQSTQRSQRSYLNPATTAANNIQKISAPTTAHKNRPPKPQQTAIKQGLGGDQCAWCCDLLITTGGDGNQRDDTSKKSGARSHSMSNQSKLMSYELTVNQIIKLYEYFENSPAGLLILPASSDRQQKFFEEVYAQVAFGKISSADNQQQSEQMSENNKAPSRSSYNNSQQVRGSSKIPVPLRQAFDLTSMSKFTVLKNDPGFVYKTVKICPHCYNSVKQMLVYQTKEQMKLKSETKTGEYQSKVSTSKQMDYTGNDLTPIKQGWVNENTDYKSQSQILKDISGGNQSLRKQMMLGEGSADQQQVQEASDTATDLDSNSISPAKQQAQLLIAQTNAMFAKVQKGKEVSQEKQVTDGLMGVESMLEIEAHAKSELFSHQNQEAVSLEIKNSAAQGLNENRRMSLKQQKTAEMSLQNHTTPQQYASAAELNDQIELFVKQKGLVQQSQKLKNMQRNKPASAKVRVVNSGFNMQDKKQLRDARRNLKKQKEQTSHNNLFNQHRILMHQSSPIAQHAAFIQQNNYFQQVQQQPSQKSLIQSTQQQMMGQQNYTKMRPISAKPNFASQKQPRHELNLDGVPMNQHPSLQPASEYTLPPNMFSSGVPSSIAQTNQAYSALDSQEAQSNGTPFVYTKYDAARVYLNSVNKGDVNINGISGQQQRSQLQQKITSQRLSSQQAKQVNVGHKSGIPLAKKPRDKSNKKQQRRDLHYGWQRPITAAYPASKIGAGKSRSPIKYGMSAAQSQQTRQMVQRSSIDMFNYQSGASSINGGKPTNIVVPTNNSNNAAATNSLAASLLNIKDMPMNDIDQIAENADNLIEILQTIKQVKQKSVDPSSLQQQQQQYKTNPIEGNQPSKLAQDTPAFPKPVSQPVEQDARGSDIAAEKPSEDFWDSHTHSPPPQQKNQQQAEQDFWGDDQQVRVPPEDSPAQSNDYTQKVVTKKDQIAVINEYSQSEYISGIQSSQGIMTAGERSSAMAQSSITEEIKTASVKSPVKKKNTKAASTKDKKAGAANNNKKLQSRKSSELPKGVAVVKEKNSDLQVVESDGIPLPIAEISMRNSQASTIVDKGASVGSRTSSKFISKKDAKRNQIVTQTRQSQQTDKKVKVDGKIDEFRQQSTDSIPEPLAKPKQSSGFQRVQAGKEVVVSQGGQEDSGTQQNVDVIESYQSNQLPANIMDQIESMVQQRVQAELSKSQKLQDANQQPQFTVYPMQDNFNASGISESMPEELISEAFNTAGRQLIAQTANENGDEVELSRIDEPDLSPVPLQTNPEAGAMAYAVVDNRFLESSCTNKDMMSQAVQDVTEDDYTQEYSSIIKEDLNPDREKNIYAQIRYADKETDGDHNTNNICDAINESQKQASDTVTAAEPVQQDAGAAAVMTITQNNDNYKKEEEAKGEDESYSMIESFVQDTSVLNQSQVNAQK